MEGKEGFGFSVLNKGKAKGFAWLWNERVDPKKARVPNPNVLAVIVRNLTEKEIILGSDSEKFFTEAHYNGFPAVLVRLSAVEYDELEDLLVEAWRTKAPKDLIAEYDRRLSAPDL